MRMRRCRRYSLYEFTPTKLDVCGRNVTIAYVSCIIQSSEAGLQSYALTYTDSIHITKYLLNIGTDPNEHLGLPLNVAVECRHVSKTTVLIESGARTGLILSRHICSIIRTGRIDMLRILLQAGMKMDYFYLENMCRQNSVLKEYLSLRDIDSGTLSELLQYTREHRYYDSMKLLYKYKQRKGNEYNQIQRKLKSNEYNQIQRKLKSNAPC